MSIQSSRASSSDSAHQALRAGTGRAHEELDALFGAFDLSDARDYGRFLSAHAGPLFAVERALDDAGMATLMEDWPARHRADRMRADLAALGLLAPAPLAFSVAADPAAAWGAAYVVEGSRLGGAMLARRVPEGLPTSYLAAPQEKGAWRKFLAKLDESLYEPDMRASAIQSALATFALFGTGGRAALAR